MIVYAGAVMVLYVFVVAYVGGMDGRSGRRRRAAALRGRLACCSRARCSSSCAIALLGSGPRGARRRGRAATTPGFGTPAEIGRLFLTKFLLAFEVASLLLLVAAVGAVILARRRSGLDDPREISVADLHARATPTRDAAARTPSTMLEAGGPPHR